MLKYINSACKYMHVTPAWMGALQKPLPLTLPPSVPFSIPNGYTLPLKKCEDEQKGGECEYDCASSHFSYQVPTSEEDWQTWPMASYVHPALMEAIYRG